ncbi:hypothetical protein, partial [Nocardioides salarius]|uniref:hypothetical protein n=1 Tax=Nocardioides salarius TaxID=374513 RepID=UPI0030F86DC5
GPVATDAPGRAAAAAYSGELAGMHPALMDHVSSGGGGLLDSLQLRSLLSVSAFARDDAPLAAAAGLRALGIEDLGLDVGSAARDIAGGLLDAATGRSTDDAGPDEVDEPDEAGGAPRGREELLVRLVHARSSVEVRAVGGGRFVAYLAGPDAGRRGPLRLVSGDRAAYADVVVGALERAVRGVPDARVMLVGGAHGGATAAEVAAGVATGAVPASFSVEQVVTAGAPAAQVPRIPAPTRVLSLEDRSDPVALLGSLVNAGAENRLTVVFDARATSGDPDAAAGHGRRGQVYVAGGRAADRARHAPVVAELERLRDLGYLAR